MELTEAWFQQIIDREMQGVEIVMLEQAGSRRQRVLRLFVDHPEGVTHELCARISESVGRTLDETDAIDGAYTLEVSSPGIERPLRKQSHFVTQLGKKVYVKTRVPIEGSKVWQGTLLEAVDDRILVREAGREATIPLAEISDAHLIYEFK